LSQYPVEQLWLTVADVQVAEPVVHAVQTPAFDQYPTAHWKQEVLAAMAVHATQAVVPDSWKPVLHKVQVTAELA